jgi:hypothetical protein
MLISWQSTPITAPKTMPLWRSGRPRHGSAAGQTKTGKSTIAGL